MVARRRRAWLARAALAPERRPLGRRYWRRVAEASRPSFSAWLALFGLLASFAAGWYVLVPAFDPESPTHGSGSAQGFVASQPAAAPVEAEPAQSSPAVLAAGPEPTAENVSVISPEPARDNCRDAMLAALAGARIEFLSASADIVPASRNVIAVLAALAHTCPGVIVVDGHSDSLGVEEANERISLERAQAVVDAFVDFGIEPQRLRARGFGSREPIADNDSAEGRARNRRIEMSLVEESVLPATGEQ